jgi:hypothetical protein
LSLSGQASLTVNGAVDVNSNATTALSASNQTSLSATSIGVVGGVSTGKASIKPKPVTITPVGDRFAAVPTPSLSGTVQPPVTVSSGTKSITPGIYSSLSVSGGTLTLQPGVYVVTQSVSVSMTGTLTGSGVTLYLACGTSSTAQACASGQSGATFTVGDQGTYVLSAPTSGTFSGLTIFADRNNTSTLSLSAQATDGLTGGIYAKSGALSLVMQSPASMSARIVVGTFSMSGQATLTVSSPPSSALAMSSDGVAGSASTTSDGVAGIASTISDGVAGIASAISDGVSSLVALITSPAQFASVDGGATQ